ncbi:MAG: polysaccharide export protein [Opitutaceae bacterium]|nr:polysaccharide export protein [Opitutaceae bacterium]
MTAHAQETAAEANSASPARAVREDYIIQPLDVLRVQVFQEDDLLREVRVTQGGSVSLPLIGTVSVRNLSVKEAQEKIRELYDRDYLVNPQVNLSVLEYAKRTVNVLGSVNSPGAVLFPQEEGLSLLDAIARAGGFNRFADRRKIRLSRTDSDGRTETFVVDADNLMQSGTNDSWPLQRDDVIFVPERIF